MKVAEKVVQIANKFLNSLPFYFKWISWIDWIVLNQTQESLVWIKDWICQQLT